MFHRHYIEDQCLDEQFLQKRTHTLRFYFKKGQAHGAFASKKDKVIVILPQKEDTLCSIDITLKTSV